MASRVVTSWMASLGTTLDFSRAASMTLEMATKEFVDSLPPVKESAC